MAKERLQKILARAGITSRRKAEALIQAGRVRVSGQVVSELGAQADLNTESVEVDGRRLTAEPLVYLAFHKPRAVMCTLHDPEGRTSIVDFLKHVPVRVVPVGRLDFQTSGILLLTNDGDFAAALAHPRTGAAKEYVAKVQGVVSDTDLERWRQSIVIDGRPTQPAEVKRLRVEGEKTWLSLVLHEGRNRQVRRLGEEVGFPVVRLVRMSFAGITHEGIRLGEFRHLTMDELRELKQKYGVPQRVHTAVDLAELERNKSPRSARRGEDRWLSQGKASRRSSEDRRDERDPRPGKGVRSGQAPNRRAAEGRVAGKEPSGRSFASVEHRASALQSKRVPGKATTKRSSASNAPRPPAPLPNSARRRSEGGRAARVPRSRPRV